MSVRFGDSSQGNVVGLNFIHMSEADIFGSAVVNIFGVELIGMAPNSVSEYNLKQVPGLSRPAKSRRRLELVFEINCSYNGI